MAHRKSFIRGGKARRETVWIAISPTQTAIATASTASLIGTLNAASLALRPFTVIRTRGVFFVRPDQISANENYGCALGHAVVSDQASAIGVTAVPTPQTDRTSDLWYVYEEVLAQFAFTTGVGYRDIGHLIHYDSKAMRRVNNDQDIAIVLETPSTNDSGSSIGHAGRLLVKLH